MVARARREHGPMIKALSDPIVDDGISFTAYFNGRLLSGEDLARDQVANREARRRIGQAIGDGVAFGLEVFESPGESSKTTPVLTVQPGTAIARDGHALSLGRRVDLQLVRPATGSGAAGTVTTFRVCDPPRPGVFVVGEGVYVLVMAAAQATEGRAPVSGLTGAASCSVRSVVEGVQFRLVQPKIAPEILNDVAHLRNRVAAVALGISERFSTYTNPLAGAAAEYGLVDSLRDDGAMTDADVPLALLHWTAATGITYVDMWAVRRRVTARGADADWSWLFGDRIRAEAEATFFAFQEHVGDIAASGEDVPTIAATDRFFYLPPIGMLPLQIGTRPGFDVLRFFGADMLPKDIAYTDGTLLRALVQESFAHDPIVLATPQRLQLYFVFENIQSATAGQSVTPVVIFASPRLPYRGVARYGFARWDQARFAPRVI
jgi:hypothetical protein